MTLLAGVGRANITPPLDIPQGIWKAQKHVRAEGLDMDLYATALVLRQGDETVAILELDQCFLSLGQAAAIRQAAAAASGIAAENIWPFCTHNHAGPVTLETYRSEGADRVHAYLNLLPGLCAGAVRQAALGLAPVRLAAGWGESDIAVNRDWPRPEGGFALGINDQGFHDPAVGVLRVDRLDGSPLTCLITFGCHPTVLGPGNRWLSPDYPGHAKRTVEQATGATCLFLQGAGGNVHTREVYQSDVAVARRLGARLGFEAAKVYTALRTRPVEAVFKSVIASGAPLAYWEYVPLPDREVPLHVINTTAPLPVRKAFSDTYQGIDAEVARWEAEVAKTGDPVAVQQLERARLRQERIHRFRAMGTWPAEVHGLALGDIAFIAVWGEPYAELGARVKAASPFPTTLFASCVGGDANYIAPAELYALADPPYEVRESVTAPEAADVLVGTCLDVLRRLRG